jgi:hypothetical protein
LLLGLARAVTLRSKSRRTHGLILLSHLRLHQPGGPGPLQLALHITFRHGLRIQHCSSVELQLLRWNCCVRVCWRKRYLAMAIVHSAQCCKYTGFNLVHTAHCCKDTSVNLVHSAHCCKNTGVSLVHNALNWKYK